MPLHLTTERLLIEPLGPGDVPGFAAYRQDPEVARWQSWTTEYSRADALALVASQPTADLPGPDDWLQLAVRDRSTGELYGDVAVHRLAGVPDTFEVGMTLARRFQHRGVALEAVGRVLEHLFADGGAHRVTADCDSRNAPVARLLRTLGMRQESHHIDADFSKGEWITLDGYAVLADEFVAQQVSIRPGQADDAAEVAEVYLSAIRSELGYLQRPHTDDEVRAYFGEQVLPHSRVLVAVRGPEVVGFGAYGDGELDHLYVRPDLLRLGIGAALLRKIKTDSPNGLRLWAFQRNWAARSFYRRHGFVPTAFTDGAGNEEREPDLLLCWTPPDRVGNS